MAKLDYTIGFEKGGVDPYAHIQNENVECEVDSNDINLKSFKLKNNLENNIWDDGVLNLRVRMVLMDISDDFWSFCNIKWVKPKNVLLTGSICNFNWSSFSDIDLHIVVDFSEIHKNKDFVQEYFNEKKNDWNNSHDDLKVFGYKVELYVEDVDAETESSGIYDLWKNKWVKEPSKNDLESIKLDKYAIKDISAKIMTEIDDIYDESRNEDDEYRLRDSFDKVEMVKKRIKELRKIGLKKGEMGPLNIVYKVLRRSGYLDKLRELGNMLYDKINSINENKSFVEKIMKRM